MQRRVAPLSPKTHDLTVRLRVKASLLLTCAMAALLFAMSAFPSLADAQPNYPLVSIPPNLSFGVVATHAGHLVLTGTATVGDDQGVDCLLADVNPKTLALSNIVEPRCDDPRYTGSSVSVSATPIGASMYWNYRTVTVNPKSGLPRLGPVVVTNGEISDTHLEQTRTRGAIWLYAPNTRHGAYAIRIDPRTGAVLQDTLITPALDRPVIAANSDGLFLAAAANSAFLTPKQPAAMAKVVIFHLGIGARSVEPFYRLTTPSAYPVATWMYGEGASLWADICSRAAVRPSCAITRFNGTDPRPVYRVSDRGLTGYSVSGDEATGLFSAVQLSFSPNEDTSPYRIIHIDPSTGRTSVIGSLVLSPFWSGAEMGGASDLAVDDGSLYVLVPPTSNNSGTLYRIPLR
jgi:hypothetical protein